MTTETTAFMIGYGFFLLITALLTFAWKKDQKLCQELLKENNELAEAKENAIKRLYEAKDEAEKIALHAVQVRRDFIEQSELATEWRQKHDRIQIDYVHLRDESASVQNLNNEFHAEIVSLESELDRGNEMIAKIKDHLAKAYELNDQNEKIILQLLVNGKFLDKNGDYKGIPLFQDDESFDVGRYLDSLYRSKVAKDEFNSFPKAIDDWTSDLLQNIDNAGKRLEERFNEVFDFPNSIPKDEPLHDFEKIADQATQPLAGAIDWTVPQAFPNEYVVPLGVKIDCVRINGDESHIPNGKIGVLTGDNTTCVPFYYDGSERKVYSEITYLAPINPTDHPLHPEFGKEKEEGCKIASGNGCIDEPTAPQIINPINLP